MTRMDADEEALARTKPCPQRARLARRAIGSPVPLSASIRAIRGSSHRRFWDNGTMAGFLGTGTFTGPFGEAVPVPEPSGVLVGLAMCGLAGWRERRRERQARRATR